MLDVGCGKGRFARIFQERNPQAEIWGLDISEEMLRHVPAGIHTRAGSMTALPFADAWFDARLRHRIARARRGDRRAVAEICRVVKPGGRIVIIDKNAEHFGKLKTPEWEKWFRRRNWSACCAATAGRCPASSSPIGRTWSRTACSWPGSP